MKIYLATDHAGYTLKEKIKTFLQEKNYNVIDCGANVYDKNDDYPDFIAKAAKAVSKDIGSKGIIFGGSGQGEAIVANKFPNIRAAVFYGSNDSFEIVRLSKEHNNANILSLGARFLSKDLAKKAVKLWLETPFSQDERHIRRVQKIRGVEEKILSTKSEILNKLK